MSKKNYDNHNRWRNKTVAFRVSAEEDLQLETLVKLTGLTKQDYIIRRLLERDVVVQGNPKVYKALRDQLSGYLDVSVPPVRLVNLCIQLTIVQRIALGFPIRTSPAITVHITLPTLFAD